MIRKAGEKGYQEEFKELDIDLLERTIHFFTQYKKYFVDYDVPNKVISCSAWDGIKALNQKSRRFNSIYVHRFC